MIDAGPTRVRLRATVISSHAVVETDQIGSRVRVGPFAVLRAGCVIGDDVIIHPHVVVGEGVHIGNGSEILPGSHLGRRPVGARAFARPISVTSVKSEIGVACAIGSYAVVYCDVVIGDGTLVGDHASIREGCRIGARCIVSRCVTLNYEVTIGDDSKVMDLSHITGNTTIGKDVFISAGVGSANDNALGAAGPRSQRPSPDALADPLEAGYDPGHRSGPVARRPLTVLSNVTRIQMRRRKAPGVAG
jgi:UDP-3-O-[3-hydroxymyristoyl] glucosamine N-acyltransferase